MAETTNYMILGYAVVLIILVGSVAYLVLKARALRSELRTLEMLDAEDQVANQQATREVNREPLPAREPRSGDATL